LIGLEEAIREGGRRLETAWPARRWTADLRREYGDALRAIGDPEAIRDGVTAAVRGWGGDFPPPIASLCEIVWDAQRKRLERDAQVARDAIRERPQGLLDEEVAPVWHGLVWSAAVLAAARRRGGEVKVTERMAPYVAMVEELGLRCEHGCGEFMDGQHRLHAADLDYDPDLTAEALRRGREIFEESGERDTERTRREVVGAISSGFSRVDDEPWPRGPRNSR